MTDRPTIKTLIVSDLFRYRGRTDLTSGIALYILNPGFRYQVWLRLRGTRNRLVSALAKFMLGGLSSRHGIEIPGTVSIGPGLLIPHLKGIVVNSSAAIGANCTLGHGVTIGSTQGKAAIVGDDVYIGPHTCLVEHISVGDGVTIGAGSIVVKDVPQGMTVAGNPARVISTKEPGRLIKNRWSIDPPSQ